MYLKVFVRWFLLFLFYLCFLTFFTQVMSYRGSRIQQLAARRSIVISNNQFSEARYQCHAHVISNCTHRSFQAQAERLKNNRKQ